LYFYYILFFRKFENKYPITQEQAKYLTERKDNFRENEALVLMDFAEIEIEYFTDGCAGQYKNIKNFYNLCNHLKDFGIKAILGHFFPSQAMVRHSF
jgi:hypothetical protein